MKTVTGTLDTFLAGLGKNAYLWRCDLFTLTLLSGTAYYWTTADFDIVSGHTFRAGGRGNAPVISRGDYRQSAGLAIDTLDIFLGGPFTIGGTGLAALALNGFFDGASMNIDHVIGAKPGDLSIGTIPSMFEGTVSDVEPKGNGVTVRLKSRLEQFNFTLPRFRLQPQCGNVIYDDNCALVQATYTIAGAVSSATTTTIVTATAGITAKADNYFNLGVVTWTSGALNGTKRIVSDWVQSTGTITLAMATSVASSVADTFTIYPGCDRSHGTCKSTFNNLAQYRGFPRIPMPEAGG